MRLIAFCLVLACYGCAVAPQGPNRYEMEMNAYDSYLNSEVRAGRLTMEQARYLQLQKYNQLQSQRQTDRAASSADTMNTMHLLNQMQRAQQPTFLPSPTMNCTSQNINGITHTNCR